MCGGQDGQDGSESPGSDAPVGAGVASPWVSEWGYSYSYSNRWDHGMDLSAVHVGSSTSTALRAEYEYESDRGHGADGGAEVRSTGRG